MSTAIIEVQLESGIWMKIGDCSKSPDTMKAFMSTNAKSNSKWKKFRAIDSVTKQLLDLQFF